MAFDIIIIFYERHNPTTTLDTKISNVVMTGVSWFINESTQMTCMYFYH